MCATRIGPIGRQRDCLPYHPLCILIQALSLQGIAEADVGRLKLGIELESSLQQNRRLRMSLLLVGERHRQVGVSLRIPGQEADSNPHCRHGFFRLAVSHENCAQYFPTQAAVRKALGQIPGGREGRGEIAFGERAQQRRLALFGVAEHPPLTASLRPRLVLCGLCCAGPGPQSPREILDGVPAESVLTRERERGRRCLDISGQPQSLQKPKPVVGDFRIGLESREQVGKPVGGTLQADLEQTESVMGACVTGVRGQYRAIKPLGKIQVTSDLQVHRVRAS